MSGLWYVRVPEAGRNYVLNPSAEMADNYGVLSVGSPSTSASPSASASPSGSQSRSPSGSASSSPSRSTSSSASQSRSPSASASRSPSASASSSASPSPSPSAGIADVARVTTQARFGNYCYQVLANSPYDGMSLTLAALANAEHYVSLYLYDTDAYGAAITGTPQVALDGRSWAAMSVIGGRAGGWVRYGVSIPAAQASGSTRLDIRLSSGQEYFVDAAQVEPNSYGTTYMDGDRGEGYRWAGLRHGSASTRSAQVRAGGRERNLLDDYAIEVVDGSKNIGTPPVANQLADLALLPGALHQGVKVLPREIELHLHYTVEDAGSNAATWAALAAKRAQVFDLFKPDAVRGGQPMTIGYAGPGSDSRVYAEFYYSGGMEGFSDLLHVDEIAPVRLLAPDPFWYADDQQTGELDYQDSLTANYALARIDGEWQALGTGFNDAVRVIAVDKQRGRVYFGGDFTYANGVVVNGVCYWNGSTFVAIGSGVSGGVVYALKVASNGDLWVGGSFTSAGGSTSDGLARWNVSNSTWTQFTQGTPGNTFYAIEISNIGILYAGGSFTNWNGNADQDNIISYDGSTFSALGTGANGAVRSIVINDQSGLVYIGGAFTTIGGSAIGGIATWDGSSFSGLGDGISGGLATVYTIGISKSGLVAIGGNFTTSGGDPNSNFRIWNGNRWIYDDFGVNDTVYAAVFNDTGELYISGQFTSVDGSLLRDNIAIWNGSSWLSADVDIPQTQSLFAMAFANDVLYIGHSLSGTSIVSGVSVVSNNGTLSTFPRLDVINSNTSGSATLQWLENQSTDHRMYFDLVVQAGETVTFDLTSTRKLLTSDWRGRITDNPLAASDVVNWMLLPGDNTVAAFISGTITNVAALLHWTPTYWSADGAA